MYVASDTVIMPSDLSSYFVDLRYVTQVDLRGFDTSNTTDMQWMFVRCYSLQVNFEGMNTENVTNMNAMFYYCNSLTSLDLSNFDTAKVTNMEHMFRRCFALSELNISGFSTVAEETEMGYMFSESNSLNKIVLGESFVGWNDNAYLPGEYWTNGEITLSSQELYTQYPQSDNPSPVLLWRIRQNESPAPLWENHLL